MSVSKKLHIQGISIISFGDAIKTALEETAMSIDHIQQLDVMHLSCTVKDNVVQQYIADTEITFMVDKERK